MPKVLPSLIVSALILSSCAHRSENVALDASPREIAESFKLQQSFTVKCIRAEGFKYVPLPPTLVTLSQRYLDFSFSIEEAARREKSGYGIVDQQKASIAYGNSNPNQAYEKTLSESDAERYRKLVSGETSCPRPKPTKLQTLRANRTHAVRSRFTTDKRALETDKEWTGCMKKAGFLSPGQFWDAPQGARESITFLLFSTEEKARSQEMAFAKADVHCFAPFLESMNELRLKIEKG
jgi:hypothetical protein